MPSSLLRCSIAVTFALLTTEVPAEDWPCWRGPTRQGVSSEKGLPVKWSATENIAWKTKIPGEGWSSPIVCRDRVFLTATTDEGVLCHVMCLDRKSGQIVWDKEVFRQKPGNMNGENSHASPTPVTDGQRVYAVFSEGSFVALHFDGTVAWTNREHKHKSQHGLGASPLLHGDLLIMPFDGSDGEIGWQTQWDQAVLLALDAKTGQIRWKARRGLSRVAHVTPNVWRDGDRVQIVSAAGDVIQGMDPVEGKLLWTVAAPGEGVVPSVVLGDGMAFAASGSSRTLRGVRLVGQGDVAKTHIAWEQAKAVPFVPSFLYLQGSLYTIDDAGVAQCLEADSGKILWKERIGGKFRSSPVSADGKIYVLSESGDTTVFEAASQYKRVAFNSIGERCKASMALSNGQIYVRGEHDLYCIGRTGDGQ